MVHEYLETGPSPDTYDFLGHSFSELDRRYGGVVATTFSTFPSFPQRYMEPLTVQPVLPNDVHIQPIRLGRKPLRYTEVHLQNRQFGERTVHRVPRKSTPAAPRGLRLQPPAAELEQAADASDVE
jgi:hypothetical protein